MSAMTPSFPVTLERAVCCGCSCLCDDIAVRQVGGREVEADQVCSLGRQWLAGLPLLQVSGFLRGSPVSIGQAVERAVTLLTQADAPLLCGWNELTLEAIRAGVRLASAVSGLIVPEHLAVASERLGIDAPEYTASLGAVRATADVVIFWRCDPARTHPRHLERYSGSAPLLSGRQRRTVVVDSDGALAENQTAETSQRITLPSEDVTQDLRVLLRVQSQLQPLGSDAALQDTDSAVVSVATALADLLRTAKHVHVFYDRPLTNDLAWVAALHQLAAAIKPALHLTASELGSRGNDRGVTEALTWLTRWPGATWAVGRETSNWRWLPGIATAGSFAGDLLGADLVMQLGGSEPFTATGVPRIAIGPTLDPAADVCLQVPGLHPRLNATVVRIDGVLLTLCGDAAAGVPDPTVEILARLTHGVLAVQAEVSA